MPRNNKQGKIIPLEPGEQLFDPEELGTVQQKEQTQRWLKILARHPKCVNNFFVIWVVTKSAEECGPLWPTVLAAAIKRFNSNTRKAAKAKREQAAKEIFESE